MTSAALDAPGRRRRDLWWILGFAVVTILLWHTIVLFPLRCFVVLVHETGHALAALLTGASIDHLVVRPDESGEVLYRGGWPVIISAAGYVGSSLLGSILLALTAYPRWHRIATGVLGVVLVGVTLAFVPFTNFFGFVLGLGWGFALLHLGIRNYTWLPRFVNFLAVMLCFYAVYDFGDFILGDPMRTDPGILASHLGLPFLAWPIGIAWVIISLWLMYRGARVAFGLDTPNTPKPA